MGRDRRVRGRRLRRPRHVWFSRALWKQRLVFWLGGAAVGLAAVLFAWLADFTHALLQVAIARFSYLPLLATPLGFAAIAAITVRFFPGSQGSGIPQAIAARSLSDRAARVTLISPRLAAGKIGLTVMGLLVGASVGREGPTVQVGAAVMHEAGRLAGGSYRGLILAGGAAGIAAAFNTPLAGIVFAIEELSRSYEQRSSGLVLTTVIVAGLVSLVLLGDYTYFGHSRAVMGAAGDWIAVPICALVGGVVGGAFSRTVVAAARGWPPPLGHLMRRQPVVYAALCGLLVAAIGVVSGGTTYGTGYAEAKGLIEGTASVPWGFGILKLAATTLSTISGIPGGIFSPSLAVGAGVGAHLAALLPGTAAEVVVLLAMTGYFAGVVQAPITSFVIVLEMTNNHAMALPLMAVAILAYGVSRLVCPKPIYHALAEQFIEAQAERTGRAGGSPPS
jgi:H+/Cl- antiporter ClcA